MAVCGLAQADFGKEVGNGVEEGIEQAVGGYKKGAE